MNNRSVESRNTFSILGVDIDAINLASAANKILNWTKGTSKKYVCVCPVSTIMSCQDDAKYKVVVNHADMVTPDGMPVVWIGKKKGHLVERTYGPDLMRKVLDLGRKEGVKHYFFGGSRETNLKLLKEITQQFPGVNVAGEFAPGMREVNEMESDDIVDQINQSHADILWIGLGSPKQDYWMHNHRNKINTPVMIGVGAAFDFLSKTKSQAPRWMQRFGLEWLFRMMSEPRRLAKRYIVGNSRFIYLLIKEKFKAA